MYSHTLSQESSWPDTFQPTGLQLNGYPIKASDASGNLRKRTIVRKFLCDQMLRVRERSSETTLADKCLTLDGLGGISRLSKSFSCKSLRSLHSVPSVLTTETPRFRPSNNPRVLAIEGMSRHTSPASLVAAISGGALEKIVFHRSKTPLLEVHFINADSADKFYRSSQKIELSVHGRILKVSWHNAIRKSVPLAPYIREEIESCGASRVVVLSKPIAHKKKVHGSKRRYPNAEDNFSKDLNLEAMKWDFVQFGGIVEVSPVISTKLSVSIQFTDIRSAILAVNTLKSSTSLLYFKYKNWNHKYDRDVTNRACMVV